MIKIIWLVTIFAVIALALAEPQDRLVAVQVVHRHGDRTPVVLSTLHQWQKRGQLTEIGYAQAKALGAFLGHRYRATEAQPGLLTGDPKEVYARSTNTDRCLQTAQIMLSTMFPEVTVPVHSMPADLDQLLEAHDLCPSYKITYDSVMKQFDQRAIDLMGPENIRYIAQISGLGHMSPGLMLDYVYDNMVCAEAHRLPLPELLSEYKETIYNFTRDLFFNYYTMESDKDPRGSVGGSLARHMMDNFQYAVHAVHKQSPPPSSEDKDNQSQDETGAHQNHPNASSSTSTAPTPYRRLHLFSAHDINLMSLLSALGILTHNTQDILPSFVSMIGLELWQKPDGGFEVKAWSGQPVANEHAPSDQPEGWSFTTRPLPLNCGSAPFLTRFSSSSASSASQLHGHRLGPLSSSTSPSSSLWQTDQQASLSDSCPLKQLTEFVHRLAPEQGCCVVQSEYFESHGCHQYDQPFSELSPACQNFRRLCPATSCGEGKVVSASDYSCITIMGASVSSSDASLTPTLTLREETRVFEAMWLIFSLAIVFGSMVLGCIVFYHRCRKLHADTQDFDSESVSTIRDRYYQYQYQQPSDRESPTSQRDNTAPSHRQYQHHSYQTVYEPDASDRLQHQTSSRGLGRSLQLASSPSPFHIDLENDPRSASSSASSSTTRAQQSNTILDAMKSHSSYQLHRDHT